MPHFCVEDQRMENFTGTLSSHDRCTTSFFIHLENAILPHTQNQTTGAIILIFCICTNTKEAIIVQFE